VINAVSNQLQRNLETFQQDLADPSRIPSRITKQTEDFLQEASNIFSETPVGLKEPAYTTVTTTDDYEIRDYEAYTVATTSTKTDGDGLAFNTLAAYIFGANSEQTVMDMTTPVTTTASGEMRFYVIDNAPLPLREDVSNNALLDNDGNKIRIERIPAARLAVRRFGGFATAGEIARQKAALLAALQLDGQEIDVPHGKSVGHVIFQYNPPYTLPALRRNEIAVPVMRVKAQENSNEVVLQQDDDPWDVPTNGATNADNDEKA